MREVSRPGWASLWSGLGVTVVAALLGLLLRRLALLPVDDPLGGTLALMPVILAGLWWIGRESRAAGGRRLPPALVQTQLLLAALGAIAIPARHPLGLEGSAPILVAGLAALLASHVVARWIAMRPLLGRRLSTARGGYPSGLFVLLPFIAYLALIPWSTDQRQPDGDEPWYLLVTHSLVHDFDIDLTNNYAEADWEAFTSTSLAPQQGDPQGPEGQLYSRHNALLPLLLTPAYALGGKVGALAMMALLSAALAWTTLLLGSHYFPDKPGEVMIAYALVALTPPLLLYSYQVWVEVPAALLSMVALDRILRLTHRRKGQERGSKHALLGGDQQRRIWWAIALCLLFLPLIKLRFLLLAATLLFLAWWYSGRAMKPALITGTTLAILGSAILLYNQAIYGNPLKIHSWEEVKLHERAAGDFLEGFPGLFFDSAYGLFACAPIWLLLLPAVVLLVARRHRVLFDGLVFASLYFLVVAPRSEWYGGWSPPFRYGLVLLPLLGLALVPLLAYRRRPGARALVAFLAAASLMLALLWIAVPGWTYNFADGRTYLLDHLSSRLGADAARLFPSSVRPRTATWLWPPLCALLVTALWWWPRGGHRGRGRNGWFARQPIVWGVALLLLAAATVPIGARGLPTRWIELEDSQVIHRGGHSHPERWVNLRTSYRGAWVLREGEVLSAPVIPAAGARQVRLALDVLFVRHRQGATQLHVMVDGSPLTTLQLDQPDEWRRLELGTFAWPAEAERIGIALTGSPEGEQPNGAALDRLHLEWIE